MTLTVVVGASDGLVLAADGRTSARDNFGSLIPRLNDARKLLPIHGAPIAVLLSGRATFDDRPVADWCEDFIRVSFGASPPWPSVEHVAANLLGRYVDLTDRCRIKREDGVIGLVAGYNNASTDPEVWKFSAPDAFGGPKRSVEFNQDRVQVEPACETANRVLGLFGKSVEDFEALDEDDSVSDLTPTTPSLISYRASRPRLYATI